MLKNFSQKTLQSLNKKSPTGWKAMTRWLRFAISASSCCSCLQVGNVATCWKTWQFNILMSAKRQRIGELEVNEACKEIEGAVQIEIFEHKAKSSGSALVTFPKNSLPDRVCQIYRNVVRAQFKKLLAEGESTSVKEALRPEEYLFVSKNDRQLKKTGPSHWCIGPNPNIRVHKIHTRKPENPYPRGFPHDLGKSGRGTTRRKNLRICSKGNGPFQRCNWEILPQQKTCWGCSLHESHDKASL